MKKVLIVFGTRPEATKMVPLVLELRGCLDIETTVCVTAQHRDMLDGVLEPFGIKPEYDLDIMSEGKGLHDIICEALTGLKTVIEKARPDLLLVHGDTATTFAASLAAFYAFVPVGHVEAGLRTNDKYRPFPEEINRKLTTAIADIHFAPTGRARENLLKENVGIKSIYVTGNTAIDLIKHTAKPDNEFNRPTYREIDFSRRVLLMTSHRRENWGAPLEGICKAVRKIADDFSDVAVVWPMHPNTVVRRTAREILSGHERILLTENADVFDLHNLMRRSHLVLTDSGGIQEEAPAFGKPTVVLREVTERPEGLAAGTLTLAGVGEESVYAAVASLLTDNEAYRRMAGAKNPFGDGRAAERIVGAIRFYLGLSLIEPDEFGLNN